MDKRIDKIITLLNDLHACMDRMWLALPADCSQGLSPDALGEFDHAVGELVAMLAARVGELNRMTSGR